MDGANFELLLPCASAPARLPLEECGVHSATACVCGRVATVAPLPAAPTSSTCSRHGGAAAKLEDTKPEFGNVFTKEQSLQHTEGVRQGCLTCRPVGWRFSHSHSPKFDESQSLVHCTAFAAMIRREKFPAVATTAGACGF